MASTRSTIAPPVFASAANTVIPPTPIAGVSYRDPVAGPASSPDGWPYAERVNSAEFNQLMFQMSTLLSIMDKKGVLGWSSDVDYTEASVVFGSDGALYSWRSASGPNNGGAKDPTTPSTGWAPFSSAASIDVVGDMKNLRASVGAPTASATFTADQLIVSESLSGRSYRLSAFSKVINLASVGAGGMDVGTAPVNGFVAIYAIYNPSTGVSALLATNATAARQPEVYGGANMPSGFTASALISVWGTGGSSQFVVGLQIGREISVLTGSTFSTSTTQASLTPFSIASVVPRNAVSCRGDFTVGSSAATAGSSAVLSGSSLEVGRVAQSGTSPTAGATIVCPFPNISISVAQTLNYRASVSAGTLVMVVNIGAYMI